MDLNNTIVPEEFTRVENYLLDKMTVAEKNNFEAELKTSADLQEKVDIQKELQLSIQAGGLKESLDTIHEKVISKSTSSRNNWLAIAAGIAALVAVAVWALNMQSRSDALFAEYATFDPGQPVPMSATTDYSFYDAMVDYKAGKYNKAIEKWSTLSNENPDNKTIIYYIGASHFNQEKYTDALPYFEEVMADDQSKFQAKAQWYAVLAWLKTDNKGAIQALSPLPNSDFSDKIIAIQESLNK